MTEVKTKFGILVGVDGSAPSDAAVRFAVAEAMLRNRPLTLMHVVTPIIVGWPMGPVQGSITEWQEQNARDSIERARETVRKAPGGTDLPEVQTEILHSGAVLTLIDATREAHMVVAGSRGMGAIGRYLLGSMSTGLIHHAHCPVAVVRDTTPAAPPKADAPIVVGIDGSPASEDATALAFDEASRRGAPLVAVHAWSDVGVFPVPGVDRNTYETEGHEILAERLAGFQEQYPDVEVRRRPVCDRPADAILDEAQHAQLVVVGSHGRGGFAGMLLGSVSTAVVHGAEVPVIVARTR